MPRRIRGNKTTEEEANRGSGRRKHALDPYISFDGNEINMEIPMTLLFDPESNKKLGKFIDELE